MKLVTRVIVFLIIGLMIGVSFVATISSDESTAGRSTTLYVGGSGTGNYTSIQSAIDDASSGDTVYVYNTRLYHEYNISINKTIKLIGEYGQYPKIYADFDTQDIIPVFNIISEGTEINGFSITHKNLGILANGDSTIIKNNIFKNQFSSSGISLIVNGKSSMIVTNKFNIEDGNNRNFICLFLDSSDCIVKDNLFEHSFIGIDSNYKSNCTIKNNQLNDVQIGITIEGCRNYSIHSNKINNSDYYGIFLFGSINNSIFNNTLKNNNDGIVLYYNSDGNKILNNQISYNKQNGILVDRSYENIFMINDIKNNFDRGLYLKNSSQNVISKNNFIENTQPAFFKGYSYDNMWNNNYWDDKLPAIPKLINGYISTRYICQIKWFNIDWNPAFSEFPNQ